MFIVSRGRDTAAYGCGDIVYYCSQKMKGVYKMKWTENEIKLFEKKTDKEIVEITGRTLKAVQSKRYRLDKTDDEKEQDNFPPRVSKYEKLARLFRLCERLKVRIVKQ